MSILDPDRRRTWLGLAVRVETFSVIWIIAETVMGGLAALSVGSLAISAFSIDSAVELLSGIVLLGRLSVERQTGETPLSQWAERVASGVVAACLFGLAAFIAWRSGGAFALHRGPTFSTLGLLVAVLSSLITPWLAVAKRRLGAKLHSQALLGDAACSMTCAFMAWTLLAGLLLQRAFGWWWIDPVAALCILFFVVREAWESAESARTGQAHVHDHGHRHG